MHNRRDFLRHGLHGSALIALGSTVPEFLATAARAAEQNKKKQDKILIVVEMTGGNDGLNTVIPYGDDLYHKHRPTLRFVKENVIRIDDHLGLNPSLRQLEPLLNNMSLSIVQGVGYPNPNRSHFESMDVWQSADERRSVRSGWLGRSLSMLDVAEGRIPAFHVDRGQLPLALQGSATAVPTLHPDKPFGLDLGRTASAGQKPVAVRFPGERLVNAPPSDSARLQLIEKLTERSTKTDNSLQQFVQRVSLDTYSTMDRLREIVASDFTKPDGQRSFNRRGFSTASSGLSYELALIAAMIRADLGTRIYYVSLDGFDTHGDQRTEQAQLFETLGNAIASFYTLLEQSGDDKRVVLMTFSEFGRRVAENSSQGTDHGAASSMFLAGPAVRGGVVGKYPNLADLDDGDLKFQIDFRRVYATLLDQWLGCDSTQVLGESFEPLQLLA